MNKEVINTTTIEEQIQAFKNAGIIPKEAKLPDAQMFALTASKYNLDPVKKEIYLLPFGGKFATMVSIDGARIIANRNEDFAGVQVTYNGGKSLFAAQADGGNPITAECAIFKVKAGVRMEMTRTEVLFSEFYRKGMYDKMPFVMIGKVAEMRAYKTAFPEAMNGIHVEGEEGAMQHVQDLQPKVADLPPASESAISKAIGMVQGGESVESVLATVETHFKLTNEQIDIITAANA